MGMLVGKQQKRSNFARSGSASSVTKGRMIEAIVASMHEQEGVRVERNARLAPAQGAGTQKREIDVLMSSEVFGYLIRFAIECKNEAKAIGSPEVEAFIAKLLYVGIPPQCGIFVSVSGFTKGAIERAKVDRLRLLTLDDALRGVDNGIASSLQTIVYLLP
jgi:Restriction endonuclease